MVELIPISKQRSPTGLPVELLPGDGARRGPIPATEATEQPKCLHAKHAHGRIAESSLRQFRDFLEARSLFLGSSAKRGTVEGSTHVRTTGMRMIDAFTLSSASPSIIRSTVRPTDPELDEAGSSSANIGPVVIPGRRAKVLTIASILLAAVCTVRKPFDINPLTNHHRGSDFSTIGPGIHSP